MKFIVLFAVFIAISEARPNERIEETIKSRLAQIFGFSDETDEIGKNFNTTIKNDVAELMKKILEINDELHIQGNQVHRDIEIEKSDDALIAKDNANRSLENIRKNFDLISSQLFLLNDNLELRVKDFTGKVKNNVELLNNEIMKSAEKRLRQGDSLSQDVKNQMISFINKEQENFYQTERKIQGQAQRCRKQVDRQIEDMKNRMKYYIEMSRDAMTILDGKLQIDESYIDFESESIEQDIEIMNAVDSFNERIQANIDDLNDETRGTMKDLLYEENCFTKDIYDDVEDLKKNTKDNLKELQEQLGLLLTDPIITEIAQQFGISAEVRKPPSHFNLLNVMKINGGTKTIICDGALSKIKSVEECKNRSSYFREIEHRVIDGVIHYSEQYFKKETNTMDGFKCILDLKDPNATLNLQGISRPVQI